MSTARSAFLGRGFENICTPPWYECVSTCALGHLGTSFAANDVLEFVSTCYERSCKVQVHTRCVCGARTNTWCHVVLPAAGRPTRVFSVFSPAPLPRPTAPQKPARATPRATGHGPRTARATVYTSCAGVADVSLRGASLSAPLRQARVASVCRVFIFKAPGSSHSLSLYLSISLSLSLSLSLSRSRSHSTMA